MGAMDKKKFEEDYCRRSDIKMEEYATEMVTLPCGCGYDHCNGWAAVSNNALSIKAHINLYQK